MPKNQTNWTRAYNERAYDRIGITVPKGLKAAIEAHARDKGLSVNGLVNELLRVDMGRSEGEWKRTEDE